MNNIYDCIVDYQNGDKNKVLYIIEKMQPVLQKYAKKLKYEDAYNDLQLFLIIRISTFDCENIKNKSDGAMVNYIEKSIYHEYIKLSKNNEKLCNEMIGVDDDTIVEVAGGSEDDYSIILFEDLKSILTETEYKVIWEIYYNDLTPKEVSDKLEQTIWNVYKLKNNALKKMKKKIDDK